MTQPGLAHDGRELTVRGCWEDNLAVTTAALQATVSDCHTLHAYVHLLKSALVSRLGAGAGADVSQGVPPGRGQQHRTRFTASGTAPASPCHVSSTLRPGRPALASRGTGPNAVPLAPGQRHPSHKRRRIPPHGTSDLPPQPGAANHARGGGGWVGQGSRDRSSRCHMQTPGGEPTGAPRPTHDGASPCLGQPKRGLQQPGIGRDAHRHHDKRHESRDGTHHPWLIPDTSNAANGLSLQAQRACALCAASRFAQQTTRRFTAVAEAIEEVARLLRSVAVGGKSPPTDTFGRCTGALLAAHGHGDARSKQNGVSACGFATTWRVERAAVTPTCLAILRASYEALVERQTACWAAFRVCNVAAQSLLLASACDADLG